MGDLVEPIDRGASETIGAHRAHPRKHGAHTTARRVSSPVGGRGSFHLSGINDFSMLATKFPSFRQVST
jgi:hypothetical protein